MGLVNMQIEDFTLDRIDKTDKHEDYWYKVSGESKKKLTDKYMEMCMIEVAGVVYSKDEDVVGIKRLFPFNFDVVISEDEELKEFMRQITE